MNARQRKKHQKKQVLRLCRNLGLEIARSRNHPRTFLSMGAVVLHTYTPHQLSKEELARVITDLREGRGMSSHDLQFDPTLMVSGTLVGPEHFDPSPGANRVAQAGADLLESYLKQPVRKPKEDTK
jgi:hypothetical protein